LKTSECPEKLSHLLFNKSYVIPVKISCRALATSSSLHCLGAQIPQRIGKNWIVKENKRVGRYVLVPSIVISDLNEIITQLEQRSSNIFPRSQSQVVYKY